MTKRMLIDSTHAEETRVVVLDGNRLEDFDVETSTKRQLKGNIYLAKVVRVEPSLQAAFVEYGGGRHGFLAFGEIHPDYYQIPVADRQRLLQMQAEEAREEEEDDEPVVAPKPQRRQHTPRHAAVEAVAPEAAAPDEAAPDAETSGETAPEAPEAASEALPAETAAAAPETTVEAPAAETPVVESAAEPPASETPADTHDEDPSKPRPAQAAQIPQEVKFGETSFAAVTHGELDLSPPLETASVADHVTEEAGAEEAGAEESQASDEDFGANIETDIDADLPPPETIGGEADVFEGNGAEEARQRRASRFLRTYRIQEVIRRRQIMLIQVVKEERGTKGAALTTYISLAGRFCVLMPNSPRGGGISRKITSAADRRRLKEITAELEIPQGMGLIVRTAGAARPKPEIKRDCEYLMRLWDDIRDHTMRSSAPALIYEEASLIKRSIRDVYSRDVDEVLVDGHDGWKAAHDFMRMLMPSHAKKVQLWRPGVSGHTGAPLFATHGVEAQLDSMLSPNVQLKSGGYLVINQAEALVAIDVNSGRSTRERGIEETALRTNMEAAEEVARQLRLRDLAGLIVIDFIDMESKKNNAMVERRLKEALKNDRARIQVGFISHFGLLEMSRQRLRPSLTETNFITCPHCNGLGHVRGVESSAIHVLRAIEEEGAKGRASLIMMYVANAIVMYLLNNKRDRLAEIEARYAMLVHFTADDTLVPPAIRIDRLKPAIPEAERVIASPVAPAAPVFDADDTGEDSDVDITEDEDEAEAAVSTTTQPRAVSTDDGERRGKRRRRRRGGRREGATPAENAALDAADDAADAAEDAADAAKLATPDAGNSVTAIDADALESELQASALQAGDAAGAETPVAEAPELDENGEPRARRRGRRGGRRRGRRETTGEEASGEEGEIAAAAPEIVPTAPAYVPPVYVAPAYTGPTPANPFGGDTYDIFDMIEQAEQRQTPHAAPPVYVPDPILEIDTTPIDIPPPPVPMASVAPVAAAAPVVVEPVVVQPVAEPAVAEPVAVAPVVVAPIVVEPVTEATVASEPAAAPEPEPEPPAAPVIKPILVGEEPVPPAAKKSGWWRR